MEDQLGRGNTIKVPGLGRSHRFINFKWGVGNQILLFPAVSKPTIELNSTAEIIKRDVQSLASLYNKEQIRASVEELVCYFAAVSMQYFGKVRLLNYYYPSLFEQLQRIKRISPQGAIGKEKYSKFNAVADLLNQYLRYFYDKNKGGKTSNSYIKIFLHCYMILYSMEAPHTSYCSE